MELSISLKKFGWSLDKLIDKISNTLFGNPLIDFYFEQIFCNQSINPSRSLYYLQNLKNYGKNFALPKIIERKILYWDYLLNEKDLLNY